MTDTTMTAPQLAASDSPTDLMGAARYFFQNLSPRVLSIAIGAAAVGRLQAGGFSSPDLLVMAALLAFWPLQEWLIHVFILHYKPVSLWGRHWDFPVPKSHRRHHRDPWNVQILFIPSHVYLYALPVEALFWFGLMPTESLAWTGLLTYLLLTLNYEWLHFLVHTRYRPRHAYYERIWRNHRLHHCKNERYWFGVSRLEADWLLGTAPELSQVPTSSTCRSLGFDAAALVPKHP